MDKKRIVNDLYQAAVISVFAVGYSVLGKNILKIAPSSIQKFDLETRENWLLSSLCQRWQESISSNKRSY